MFVVKVAKEYLDLAVSRGTWPLQFPALLHNPSVGKPVEAARRTPFVTGRGSGPKPLAANTGTTRTGQQHRLGAGKQHRRAQRAKRSTGGSTIHGGTRRNGTANSSMRHHSSPAAQPAGGPDADGHASAHRRLGRLGKRVGVRSGAGQETERAEGCEVCKRRNEVLQAVIP